MELGVPVKVNIENGVAAMAIAWLNGVKPEDLKKGMATFAGPRRRFDFHLKTDQVVLIDDYAIIRRIATEYLVGEGIICGS